MNEEKLPIVPQKLIKTLSNIDLTIPSSGKILPVSWLEKGELNNSQIHNTCKHQEIVYCS